MMQAVILCGGKGTRLRAVIGEKQKTMTEVDNKPFLADVVHYLKTYKITNVIFATGYKSAEVRNYFGDRYYYGIDVSYAEEKVALGTGGAIRNALPMMKYDYVLVVNGDTLFKADLYALEQNFKVLNADMSIACKSIDDKSRYGTIKIDYSGEKTSGNKKEGVIVSFDEKVEKNIDKENKEGYYINGGIYIISRKLIESIPKDTKISLEKELIPKWLKEGKLIGAVVSESSFIDIGTPESLEEYKRRNESKL